MKEIVILGRTVRWCDWGIEYEGNGKYRRKLLEHFGFDDSTRGLASNGEKSEKEEDWEFIELEAKDATLFRSLAATLNYMALDSPDLQYPIKESSKEMARPKQGSWKRMKRVVRYLINRERIVWEFHWQDEVDRCYLITDSDWGGSSKDRKSTSGGGWMLGSHCIKTWSATQGPYALSSGEAELYGMVEGVTRAKGLLSLAWEIGFSGL
jgi:hypothetical protein